MRGTNRKTSSVNEEKTIYDMPMPQKGALTVRDAAALCGKNPETIRRWVWTGRIQAEKVGNQLFIERSQLEKSRYEEGHGKVMENKNLAEFLRRADKLRERIRKETGGKVFDISQLIEESRASRDF
jgi:excisionase family DNA binding protein